MEGGVLSEGHTGPIFYSGTELTRVAAKVGPGSLFLVGRRWSAVEPTLPPSLAHQVVGADICAEQDES